MAAQRKIIQIIKVSDSDGVVQFIVIDDANRFYECGKGMAQKWYMNEIVDLSALAQKILSS